MRVYIGIGALQHSKHRRRMYNLRVSERTRRKGVAEYRMVFLAGDYSRFDSFLKARSI